jgi:hypothetical protein
MTTMRDATHIEKYYLEPMRAKATAERGIQTMDEAMASLGHARLKTTHRYYSRQGEKK